MEVNSLVFTIFLGVVLLLFFLDIRKLITLRENTESKANSIRWSLIWIGSAMIFSLFILREEGMEKFYQFQSAYWIEQSLSVDNLFVFLMVFRFFDISIYAQNKVLIWGIIGAMILRAIFIFGGVWLIEKLEVSEDVFNTPLSLNPIIILFGFLLVYGGVKTFMSGNKEETKDFNETFTAKWLVKRFKIDMSDTERFHRGSFRKMKFTLTKLFVILVIIETTDLLFAMDSIPAIFSVAPDDPYILYSSNIFAIFGLRSLYFLLADSMDKFSKLQYGIAFILVFIGLKMAITPFYEIPSIWSLVFILGTLVISVLLSLRSNQD